MSHLRSTILIFGLLLSGCASDAYLDPVNSAANSTGALNAQLTSYGTGHGDILMTMPDGELLKGEYSLSKINSKDFGHIYNKVYDPRSRDYTASQYDFLRGSQSPYTLFAHGNKGTEMECEFYNDDLSGVIYGGCTTSKGLLYQIHS